MQAAHHSAIVDPAWAQTEVPDMEPLGDGRWLDDDVAADLDADDMFGWDTELDIARWELAIERQRELSIGTDALPF